LNDYEFLDEDLEQTINDLSNKQKLVVTSRGRELEDELFIVVDPFIDVILNYYKIKLDK
jgi:hypothetical protein